MGGRLTGMQITRATLLCAGLLTGCVASELPAPSPRSPASVHAAEAAPRRVASSLESDPLNEAGQRKSEDVRVRVPSDAPETPPAEHEHHHHHSAQAVPYPPTEALSRGQADRAALAADGGIAGPPSDGGTPAPRMKTEYVCLMHPEVRQPAAGRCPKCGMQLVPKSTPDAPHPQPSSSAVHDDQHHSTHRDTARHSTTIAAQRASSTSAVASDDRAH